MQFSTATIIAALATFAAAIPSPAPAPEVTIDEGSVIFRRDTPGCVAVTNKGIPNCVLSTPAPVNSNDDCLAKCQADSRCQSFGTFPAYPSGTSCVTYAYTIESNKCTSPQLSATGSLFNVAGCPKYCSGRLNGNVPNGVLQIMGAVPNDAACISKCKGYSGCKAAATLVQSGQGLTCFLYATLIENNTSGSLGTGNAYDVAGCP